MTKDEARQALVQIMTAALDDCGEIDLNADELEEAANYAAGAACNTPYEVLAAAMGGTCTTVVADNKVWLPRVPCTFIVLPPQEEGE